MIAPPRGCPTVRGILGEKGGGFFFFGKKTNEIGKKEKKIVWPDEKMEFFSAG